MPTVLGPGPLEFCCVEPFQVLSATFDGTAVQTSTVAVMEGNSVGLRVDVQFTIRATMAAPPWINGQLSAEATDLLHSFEGVFMGGAR
jgi:hypothetical protein